MSDSAAASGPDGGGPPEPHGESGEELATGNTAETTAELESAETTAELESVEIEDSESVSADPYPVTDEIREEFHESFRANADDLARFKRRRRRLDNIDRVSPIVLVAAGLSLGLSFLLLGTPYSALYFSVDLLALGFGGLFGGLVVLRLLYAGALWRSPLDSERVAAHELSAAMTAFGDGTAPDTETVVDHLESVREFLGYTARNDLLAPQHATALSTYATQIVQATDRRRALVETFPTVAGVATAAFAQPETPTIRDRAMAVETEPETTEGTVAELRRDAETFAEFLLSRPVGILSTAVALGAITGLLYGVWQGATVGLGLLAGYAGARDLLGR
jgi:hypothetical protein